MDLDLGRAGIEEADRTRRETESSQGNATSIGGSTAGADTSGGNGAAFRSGLKRGTISCALLPHCGYILLLEQQKEFYKEMLQQQQENFKCFVQMIIESTNKRLDDVIRDLQGVKTSLEFTQANVDVMNKEHTTMEIQIKGLENELRKSKEELNKMPTVDYMEKLDYIDNQHRRNNIFVDGIPDEKGENWIESERKVRTILETNMGLDAKNIEFERAHRVGHYQEGDRMATYKVTVTISKEWRAEASDRIYLTLMDSEKQSSERTLVNHSLFSIRETEISLDIQVKKSIGKIVQVKLEKEKTIFSYPWFCKHIKVQTPAGDCFEFPCYCWLVDENEVMIREGTARLPQDDTASFQEQRKDELEHRQKIFRWNEWRKGFPKSIDAEVKNLPKEVQFDADKNSEWKSDLANVIAELVLDKMKGLIESWKDIADIENIFGPVIKENKVQATVIKDWNKDFMFGYQFLNGCNPVMIRKCTQLPKKFPVTHQMVQSSLKRGHTLQQELQAGNIYIADYEILNDVETAEGRYLIAPICLLYKNEWDQMLPIAIQVSLSQTPGEMSPIFLPSDNEYDWMLAKMWVKSSDFNVHQLVTHLLRTHLISEVFEMAMYRQLSPIHPVYKLLMPHVRFTIAINAKAREGLISKDGIFSKISSMSFDGRGTLIKNGMKTLTFKSLCLPEDIKVRGMEDVPKYYYRDDGMKIWETINCFVSYVVNIYYKSDEAVQQDVEIQGFVKDVAFGMNNSDSEYNFPKSLGTREELVEYLTVVIFTASAQHAAVNFGQFDWYGWIPNSPSTMRKLPPQQKGQADMDFIMESLPNRGCSSEVLGTVRLLTRTESNELFLGMYPDMYFTEQPAEEAIKTFQHKLKEVTNTIKSRNEELTLPYCYLSPDKIPNSVAI
ncbi:polyunsaturated fatty acid 5-lipoxygenase-like [Garra rufa]|uniref:polyunsaturated fatty acid 5-lipoxygenase-like n=1 Tax=Garra rufa TaxID=137080 RepID=UPI003CCEF2AF